MAKKHYNILLGRNLFKKLVNILMHLDFIHQADAKFINVNQKCHKLPAKPFHSQTTLLGWTIFSFNSYSLLLFFFFCMLLALQTPLPLPHLHGSREDMQEHMAHHFHSACRGWALLGVSTPLSSLFLCSLQQQLLLSIQSHFHSYHRTVCICICIYTHIYIHTPLGRQ